MLVPQSQTNTPMRISLAIQHFRLHSILVGAASYRDRQRRLKIAARCRSHRKAYNVIGGYTIRTNFVFKPDGEIFSMIKAAQGFLPRRTFRTPQAETRGERRASEKDPIRFENTRPS
jgi:hypothetical protein